MNRRARIRPNRYETGFDEPPPTIVDVNDNYGPFTHRHTEKQIISQVRYVKRKVQTT
jgi:hypothetical protein